jgi:hypothetical protein
VCSSDLEGAEQLQVDSPHYKRLYSKPSPGGGGLLFWQYEP